MKGYHAPAPKYPDHVVIRREAGFGRRVRKLFWDAAVLRSLSDMQGADGDANLRFEGEAHAEINIGQLLA